MFSLTQHSFDITYLLTLGYMFRFSRNHQQALSKKYKGLMMIPRESKHVAQGQ